MHLAKLDERCDTGHSVEALSQLLAVDGAAAEQNLLFAVRSPWSKLCQFL